MKPQWIQLYLAVCGWVLLPTLGFGLDALRDNIEALLEPTREAETESIIDWASLGEAIEKLAGSTDIEGAQAVYLKTLDRLDGGMPWREDPEVSNLFQAWLEDALLFADEPAALAKVHFWLAQHLHAHAVNDGPVERIGRLYEFAVELDALPESMAWSAVQSWARWAEDFGIQSFDAQGEVVYDGDYAFAVELYQQLLTEYPEPDEEARTKVEQALNRLTAAELAWLRPQSFFPESEIQARLRSRNLSQVHVELHPVTSLDALQINESGELDVKSDQQWQTEALNATVFTPQPPRPHYSYERVLTVAGLDPGAYHLRARAGELLQKEWVTVTDFALIVQRDAERLHLLAVQSETGQMIENVQLRIWFESDSGEWADYGATIEQPGVSTFNVPEAYRSARYVIAGKWQNRISLVRGSRMDLVEAGSSQAPEWSLLPDRLKASQGSALGWRAVPHLNRQNWTSSLDWDAGVRVQWLDKEGRVVAETEPEVSDLQVLSGRVETGQDWRPGLYRAVFKGYFANEQKWTSSPIPAFYVSPELRSRVEAKIQLQGQGDELVPVVLPTEGLRGLVRLTTPEGAPVPAASLQMVLRSGPDGPTLSRVDGLQTNAEGELEFEIPEAGFNVSTGYVWLGVELAGASVNRLSGKWLQIVNQPFRAELNLAERIHRTGDQLQVWLVLSSEDALPASVLGTLIVNRERWRSVYVHRRRGNEISGEDYRELPERSLLGTSQGDFRLRDEGFVTEEVRRFDLRVENGQAVFTLPAGEPGFYRMSWVTSGQGGRSVQADTRFWVAGDAQRHMNYRPEHLEIIPSGEAFTRNRSNRVLIASPFLNSFALLSKGTQSGKQQQWLELPNRTRMIDLQIQGEPGNAAHLEVNVVHQGQWLRDRRILPVRQSDAAIRLNVERTLSYLSPGQTFEAEIQVLGADNQPVAVELYTFVRSVKEVAVLDRMRNLVGGAVNAPGFPWETTSSIESYPYPGSIARRDEEVQSTEWCQEMERQLVAELENLTPRPGSEGAYKSIEKLSAEGPATLRWSLPEVGGDWVLEWVAVDAKGRVAQHREWVSTRDILGLDMELPAFSRVGDELRIRFQADNAFEAELSGALDIQVWIDGQSLVDESRVYRLEPGASLREEIAVMPLEAGELKVRVEMDRLDEPVYLKRTVSILPGLEPSTAWQASALTPSAAREVENGHKEQLTADPWTLLGAAARDAERWNSESVDELAVHLLFIGKILNMQVLPREQLLELEQERMQVLAALVEAQNSDGGWSWVGQTGSDPWTSALVVFAFAEALPGDVVEGLLALENGRQYLSGKLMQNTLSPRLLAWLLHATAHYQARFGAGRPERLEARGFIQLMRDWEQLDPDVQGLLLVIAYQYRFEEEIRTLTDSLLANPVWDPSIEPSVDSDADGWRYPGLRFVLWFRGLLWANPETRVLLALEPSLVESLFPGGSTLTTARFAQSVYAEFLVLRDHNRQLLDATFADPVLYDWSPEALDSVVADPYIYGLSRVEGGGSQVPEGWNYQRHGELRRLTPTLLRGLVEEVQPWSDDQAVAQGSRLQLIWEWNLDRPQERMRIDIPLPAGWVALPAAGHDLVQIEPEGLLAHRSYSEQEQRLSIYLPQVPEGEFRLSMHFQAQGVGTFQIFSPIWTPHDSSKVLRFEAPLSVEIVPSRF